MDEPCFVRLNTAVRRGRALVYGTFYRRLARPGLRVGPSTYRALLLKRVDHTNVVEAFLGRTRRGDSHVVVVTDRILDVVEQHLLPVLADSKASRLGPVDRAYASAVRRELRRLFDDEAFARLQRAARHHVALCEAVESIRNRRHCSHFRIDSPRWNGYTPRTLDRLQTYAERDKVEACPSVTFEEADTIEAASDALQNTPIKRVIERLVARVSRMVAIHEARHRADDRTMTDDQRGPTCPGCQRDLAPSVRSELSAYVASLARSETPDPTRYQACIGSGMSVAHRRAVDMPSARLGSNCRIPPPDDPGMQARRFEKTLFDRDDAIDLHEDVPERPTIPGW